MEEEEVTMVMMMMLVGGGNGDGDRDDSDGNEDGDDGEVIMMIIGVPALRVSEVKGKEKPRERGALFTRGCRMG